MTNVIASRVAQRASAARGGGKGKRRSNLSVYLGIASSAYGLLATPAPAGRCGVTTL